MTTPLKVAKELEKYLSKVLNKQLELYYLDVRDGYPENVPMIRIPKVPISRVEDVRIYRGDSNNYYVYFTFYSEIIMLDYQSGKVSALKLQIPAVYFAIFKSCN